MTATRRLAPKYLLEALRELLETPTDKRAQEALDLVIEYQDPIATAYVVQHLMAAGFRVAIIAESQAALEARLVRALDLHSRVGAEIQQRLLNPPYVWRPDAPASPERVDVPPLRGRYTDDTPVVSEEFARLYGGTPPGRSSVPDAEECPDP